VVPGRPHESEAAAFGRLDRGAGGEQRGLEARGRRGRVSVQPGRRVDRADQLDVRPGVAAKDLVFGGGATFGPGERVEKSGDSLRQLRMVAGRVELR